MNTEDRKRYYFNQNTHVGDVAADSPGWRHARVGTAASGEVIDWHMQIDQQQRISQVRYKAHGSSLCLACCALAAESIEGVLLTDALGDIKQQLMAAFDIPPQQTHVTHLIHQAIQTAR